MAALKDLERIAQMWIEANKERGPIQTNDESTILLLEGLAELPELQDLLLNPNPSTHELGRLIHSKVQGQQRKPDQAWAGLKVSF